MGRKKKIPPLTRLAYHEAGHAVMCYLLHRRFSYVTIEPQKTDEGTADGMCKAGQLPLDSGDDLKMRQAVEKEILTLGAGHAAELVLTGQGKAILSGRDLDLSTIHANRIAFGDLGQEAVAYVQWLWLRARNMLCEPETWVLVEAVAKGLLKEKRLGYRKARRIVDEAGKRYCEEMDRKLKEIEKR